MAFPTRGRMQAELLGELYSNAMAAIPAKPAKPATAIWVASLLPDLLVALPPAPPAAEVPLLPAELVAAEPEVVAAIWWIMSAYI